MPYTVELRFDDAFDAAIRALWSDLAAAGLRTKFDRLGIAPHLTLAVMPACDEPTVDRVCASLFGHHGPFEVTIPAVAYCPGTSYSVYSAPVLNKTLSSLHEALVSALDASGNRTHQHYDRHAWLPHCTLSKELSRTDAMRTLDICSEHELTGTYTVSTAGFAEFKPRREINRYHLK